MFLKSKVQEKEMNMSAIESSQTELDQYFTLIELCQENIQEVRKNCNFNYVT